MTAFIQRNYDDNWTPKYFYILAVCLTVALLTANIVAFKFIEIMGVKFGAGMLIMPFSFILGDLISEVYGFRRTRHVIFLSLACYFVYMISTQIAVYLPPAPEWKNQEVFQKVYSQTPRIFIGGACAYLAGELSNSYLMSKMKIMNDGRYFWWRAMASTVVGELANTSVFIMIAWAGTMDFKFLIGVIITGTIIKIGIEALLLPFTTVLAQKLKKLEGVDHFDARLKLSAAKPVDSVAQ